MKVEIKEVKGNEQIAEPQDVLVSTTGGVYIITGHDVCGDKGLNGIGLNVGCYLSHVQLYVDSGQAKLYKKDKYKLQLVPIEDKL